VLRTVCAWGCWLTRLERAGLQSKNKKLYMLADVEPSRQITGGAWYSEQEFDAEFIAVLLRMCHAYVRDPVSSIISSQCHTERERGSARAGRR
jgi:DNA-directed RNA polymerase III subunit RPC6